MRTVVLFVCALGCGARQPATKELPIPAELRPALEHASTLGLALYDNQRVAARATHALVKAGHLAGDQRVTGLVVRGHLAEFIGGENEVFYRVEVSAKGDLVTTVLDPPRSLDAEGAAIVRARQQASIAAKQLRESNALCPRKYDAVRQAGEDVGLEGDPSDELGDHDADLGLVARRVHDLATARQRRDLEELAAVGGDAQAVVPGEDPLLG